ncbi:hypothetical protein CDD83_6936 [Cordyceps sp. RAO-2017]|nr:hypothetical protein CDD83_6936 [Cordyceps sp. RAO-2017]
MREPTGTKTSPELCLPAHKPPRPSLRGAGRVGKYRLGSNSQPDDLICPVPNDGRASRGTRHRRPAPCTGFRHKLTASCYIERCLLLATGPSSASHLFNIPVLISQPLSRMRTCPAAAALFHFPPHATTCCLRRDGHPPHPRASDGNSFLLTKQHAIRVPAVGALIWRRRAPMTYRRASLLVQCWDPPRRRQENAFSAEPASSASSIRAQAPRPLPRRGEGPSSFPVLFFYVVKVI